MLDPSFLQKLSLLRLQSRQIFTGHLAASHRSQARGSGLEFADVRDYAPGDDLRQVDWSLYGRMGRLFTKLYHVDQDQAVYLWLDLSASVAALPEKLQFARKLAAGLGFVALCGLDRLSVYAFGNELQEVARELRGKNQAQRLFALLPSEGLSGSSSFARTISDFLKRRPKAGLLLVISDFLDPQGLPALEALGQLAAARHEVSLLRVIAPEEESPSVRGHVALYDPESGKSRNLQLTQAVVREYQAAFRAHREGLARLATTKNMRYLELSTQTPIEEAFLGTLRHAQVLR